ncbi:hypothetical protein F503_01885 [Ophiostoma piceae UAMH 11346]|uniref:Uncharacterized protein n=1 Tax=Ophiostoma piceae (strain UAMH 11346) TaxID=1262450 RepID=S3BT63_OPHP1|nr:hypothetical protein F503_01885 [Ophiostoma piceae UAMH 11346]
MGLYRYAALALGTPYSPPTNTYNPQPPPKSSQKSSHTSSKSHRHHAVRHREPPAAAPDSRREFMLQQQQLVQEEYFSTRDVPGHVFSSNDADLAREDYISHAVAEVPGYFYNDGSASAYHSAGTGTGTRGLTLQRTHAVRSGTAPTPREGSRRAAMINGEREQQYNAHAGISGSLWARLKINTNLTSNPNINPNINLIIELTINLIINLILNLLIPLLTIWCGRVLRAAPIQVGSARTFDAVRLMW